MAMAQVIEGRYWLDINEYGKIYLRFRVFNFFKPTMLNGLLLLNYCCVV